MKSASPLTTNPISTLTDVIHFIGTTVGMDTGLASLIIAAGVSSLVIVVAWFAVRPLLSILLAAAVIGAVIFGKRMGGKKRSMRKWVLKKWKVKMKPAANNASSECTTTAMLMHHPGRMQAELEEGHEGRQMMPRAYGGWPAAHVEYHSGGFVGPDSSGDSSAS